MFDADFGPVRTIQSALESVPDLRRRTQEEDVRRCLYKIKEEAEGVGENQKNYREYGKISGGKKRLNRGKEIGQMKGRRIYGNISRGIGREEKTAKQP